MSATNPIVDLEEVPSRPKRPLREVQADMDSTRCSFIKEDGTECGETVVKRLWHWKRHNQLVHGVDVDNGTLSF